MSAGNRKHPQRPSSWQEQRIEQTRLWHIRAMELLVLLFLSMAVSVHFVR